MTSGVKCSDEVLTSFNKMHLKKNDDDPMDRPRIIQYNIADGLIGVTKVYRQRDVEGEKDVYKFFTKLFDGKLCSYFLYDCQYETKDTVKQELVFVMWAPDGTKISDKMQYSSSKQSIANAFKGVKHTFEMQLIADVLDREEFAGRLGKDIIKIEGHPVKGLKE